MPLISSQCVKGEGEGVGGRRNTWKKGGKGWLKMLFKGTTLDAICT